MATEIPVLRLGLAGYSDAQQKAAAEAVRAAASPRVRWEQAPFADADAWWLEGSRTLLMANEHLRVQPAVPSARSVQIALADVDRPVAFSLPLAAAGFRPAVTFDLQDKADALRVLAQFTGWLQPMLAQFALAASLAEHQPTLATGSWEVLRGSELLAVVDLKLGAGVLPTVTVEDFAAASWCIRDHGDVVIPTGFSRVSVSQLMWQYAQRTSRDLLPPHYLECPLYFRRPPRLAQRFVRDAHLLLMRELSAQPGQTFESLQQSTGMKAAALARCLSALYVVGSITSSRKRAMPAGHRPASGDEGSQPSNAYQSVLETTPRPPRASDLTAPLPLQGDY